MATCIEYAVYFVPNRHTANECAVYLRKEREAMNKNSKKIQLHFLLFNHQAWVKWVNWSKSNIFFPFVVVFLKPLVIKKDPRLIQWNECEVRLKTYGFRLNADGRWWNTNFHLLDEKLWASWKWQIHLWKAAVIYKNSCREWKKNKKNNNTHKNEQNINVQRHLIQFSDGFIFSICCHAASMNDSFFRFSLFIWRLILF